MTVPRTLRLDEVAEVTAGNPAPQEQTDFCIDGAPFVRMQDVGRTHWTKSLTATTDRLTQEAVARHRLRRFPRGTLLIPKSGASVNLNHRALLGTDAYVVSHLATVIPDASQLDAEYLYYWSLTYDPRHQAQTTSLPSLPTALIKTARLPVPSMPEQRRIVDVLSRAEGIVRLRREAQQKASELIPAIFIDMFGDPATNPNGWSIVSMGELVGEFRYGTSQKSGPVGVPVLRIPNVVGGAMDLTEVKLVSLTTAEHERLRLVNGDLLFVRTNGNPDFVGRCSVYDSKVLSVAGFDGTECVYASYLIRARLSDSRVSPAYLQAYLSSQRGRQLLRERAKTSAGQFNLNIDGLGSLPVPVPPQSLQRRFTESVDRFASVVSQQESAHVAAGALFRSLLARAFGAGQ